MKQEGEVKVQTGKNGINEGLVEEIKKHLKAKKTVKVKFLKAFIKGKDRKKVAEELNEKIGAKGKLVGNVLTINNGKQ